MDSELLPLYDIEGLRGIVLRYVIGRNEFRALWRDNEKTALLAYHSLRLSPGWVFELACRTGNAKVAEEVIKLTPRRAIIRGLYVVALSFAKGAAGERGHTELVAYLEGVLTVYSQWARYIKRVRTE
jgi:hypothetical protein